MSEKFVETPIEPQSSRRDMADRINRLFATSDITAIAQAFPATRAPTFPALPIFLNIIGRAKIGGLYAEDAQPLQR
jgi:hypothetical protein